MAQDKPFEIKMLIAVDDNRQRTPVWCMHYPIPCEECDIRERCESEDEPLFTWKELDDAGVNYFFLEELEAIMEATAMANYEEKRKKEEK